LAHISISPSTGKIISANPKKNNKKIPIMTFIINLVLNLTNIPHKTEIPNTVYSIPNIIIRLYPSISIAISIAPLPQSIELPISGMSTSTSPIIIPHTKYHERSHLINGINGFISIRYLLNIIKEKR